MFQRRSLHSTTNQRVFAGWTDRSGRRADAFPSLVDERAPLPGSPLQRPGSAGQGAKVEIVGDYSANDSKRYKECDV